MLHFSTRTRKRRPLLALITASVAIACYAATPIPWEAREKGNDFAGTTSPLSIVGPGGEDGAYSFDTKVRTLEILKHLRQGDVPLEVLHEILPGNGSVDFQVSIKAWDGSNFTCAPIPQESEHDKEVDNIGSAHIFKDKAPEALNKNLDNTCAILNKDYWSYEWCHRREVRQFHLNTPVDTEEPSAEPVRDPDWSLGKYAKTEVLTPEGGDRGAMAVVDYFVGGQLCHETGQGRQTIVEFYCCADGSLPSEVQARIADVPRVPYAVAQLMSVEEIATCKYAIIVCSPLLCDAQQLATRATLTGPAAASQALQLLEPMASQCLRRHDGYWSYEFCYNGSIRQFHTVAVREATGNVVSKVESEYIIGTSQPVPEGFKEEDHIILNKEEEGGDPSLFQMDYTGGTVCDLTGEVRATTVQFICGEGPVDVFVSIKEDRSCHYKAVISTPKLCRHPSFRKEKPPTHVVHCKRGQ